MVKYKLNKSMTKHNRGKTYSRDNTCKYFDFENENDWNNTKDTDDISEMK